MTRSVDGASADFSKLDDRYDILSEIGPEGQSTLYLARHRELGRDVVIAVTTVPGGAANDATLHLSEDARILSTVRHENVVPVVEGLWLDGDTFAVVRASVRGSTVSHSISGVGRFPLVRVAETLTQAWAAVDWARENGVVHRELSPDSVSFRQGNGRVMVAFEAGSMASHQCADTRSIGRLAWAMLTGTPYETSAPDGPELGALRSDLPPALVDETHAMLACRTGDAPRDVAAYIGLITAAATGGEIAPAPTPAARIPTAAGSSRAAVANDQSVIVVGQRTRAPGAMIAAIAAVVLLILFFAFQRGRREARLAVNGDTLSSPGEVGGSVASAPMNQVPPVTTGQPAPPPVAPPIVAPMTPPAVGGYPVATTQPTPMVVQPGQTTPMRITPPPAEARPDPCASTDATDQHTCFDNGIVRADAELNRTFTQTIVALRRRANVVEGENDPPVVVELRAAQRKWLDQRDADCRQRTESVGQWAAARLACFAEVAAPRVRELVQLRDSTPPS